MNNITAQMISQAHKALKNAYAPYSNYRVGATICTDKGTLFTGVNVENSSFGLTICAEASAICQMISAGEKKISSIVVLADTNQLCSPCGACRQRIFEFSNPETQIHLCNKDSILHSVLINELLPIAFDFKHK